MGLADKLRSLDQAAVRAAKPTAKPAAPTQEIAVRTTAVLTPVATTPGPAAGRAPRLRALGWRSVALVATVLALGSRRGWLGPAGAVVVGLVLTVWWGPWFYLALGVVTAAAWIWAMKVQPHEPTDNNY